jgi:hypothetical protein
VNEASLHPTYVDRDQSAEDRRWGRWYLTERCGVDPDDLAAVRDRYEIMRGWYDATGAKRPYYMSFVDAVTCAYGEFPPDWPVAGRHGQPEPFRDWLLAHIEPSEAS